MTGMHSYRRPTVPSLCSLVDAAYLRYAADRLIAPVGDNHYSTLFGLIPADLAVLREAADIEPEPSALKEWYRKVPIAELGHLTAEQLVMLGRTAAVISFIRSVRDGARG